MKSLRSLLKTTLIITAFWTGSALAEQKGMKAYVTLFPAGDFVATTSDVTGFAEIVSPTEVKASNIKVNLKTIKTGMETRDDHAKNKYLEVNKYPEAVLVSATGKNGKGTGVLKMHGKESPIDGTYSLVDGNKFLKSEFKIKLSSFGINDVNYKGVGAEDEVKIVIVVPAQPAAAAPAPAKAKK